MAADTELRVAITMTNARQLRTITNELEKMGGTQRGFREVDKTAQQAGRSVEDIGKFAKFTLSVLEAFLLYKGFVFLKTQAQEFTRELVELEHQVAIIQTQLGDVPENFQPLVRGQLLDTAERTGASLESLADAQFSIVSANIELRKSFQVLDSVTKAAVAGGLQDVNTAVESVLTQMNAFGLEAEDTTRILDKQFNLVRRGIFTYEQFARVSGMVSVAFAGIGQDLETANAALATVSQIFTGPQLRFGATALRNLASSVGENAEEFEQLGVAVFDKEGDFRNFVDIMRDLQVQLEGLSEQQRFEALRQIFPDEREIRGALAILGRLDTLEQFFIEQQFAVGDLDKAYETVNESLKTQAGILRNELIPAVEPVLLLFGDMLTIVNTLNDAIPGFTRSLLQMGAAFAALKLAGLSSTVAGGAGISQGRGPRNVLSPIPLFSRKPTGLGLALAGGVGAATLETGRVAEPGFDMSGLVTAAGTGAVAGTLLGGTGFGTAAGAAINAGIFALGEAMEKEAPVTAETWNERFRTGVLEEGKSIGEALSATIAGEFTEGSGRDLAERVRNVVSGSLQFRRFEEPPLTGFGQFLSDATGIDLDRFIGRPSEFAGFRQVDLREGIIEAVREAEEQSGQIRALAATGAASEDTIRRQVVEVAFEDFVQTLGELDEENQAQVETARNLVSILSNFETGSREADAALDILVNDGLQAFLDQLEGAVQADLPAFRETIADFRNQITFGVDDVTSALSELGLESTELGDSFGKLARTMQAIQFIEMFQEQGLLGPGGLGEERAAILTRRVLGAAAFPEGAPPTEFSGQEVFGPVQEQLIALVRGEMEEEAQSALEVFGLATVSIADVMESAATNIEGGLAPAIGMGTNELTGFAQSFREFNQRIQAIQLIEELTALSSALNLTDDQMANLNEAIVILAERALSTADTGFLEASPEDLADFFLSLIESSQAQKPDQPDTMDLPGRSQLQEAFINTADAFDRGIIQSANFTSQQLREMGSDIAIFNKQIRKIQLIEEIGRVAEIAGVGIDLTGTIQNLIQRLTIGGETLASLMEDPERLADLIATAEFRDVTIDQSDRRTFVARISTDADPSRAAELVDSMMREFNNLTQEALAP